VHRIINNHRLFLIGKNIFLLQWSFAVDFKKVWQFYQKVEVEIDNKSKSLANAE